VELSAFPGLSTGLRSDRWRPVRSQEPDRPLAGLSAWEIYSDYQRPTHQQCAGGGIPYRLRLRFIQHAAGRGPDELMSPDKLAEETPGRAGRNPRWMPARRTGKTSVDCERRGNRLQENNFF